MCFCLLIFIGGKRVVFLLFPPPPSSGEPAFMESWWCPQLTSLVSSSVAFSFLSGPWSRVWMQVHAQDGEESSGKGSWRCPAFRRYSHRGWSTRAPDHTGLRVGVLASAGFCRSVCAAESNTPESARLFPSNCPWGGSLHAFSLSDSPQASSVLLLGGRGSVSELVDGRVNCSSKSELSLLWQILN